ncbi:MAG: ATP-binding protein [bacterium]
MINWNTTKAALWRSHTEQLRAVERIDDVQLEQLVGIDAHKQALVKNTLAFIEGRPANNALLWGSRGTGKSSLIKGLLNEFSDQGLRLVEVDREDLNWLPEITDLLADQPYRFVIYCDDLSFESGDASYKGLKRVLEGSIEKPPENMLVYATSNRRHLLPEFMEENLASRVKGQEVHYADAIEEKISLSDRFGLWLSFYQPSLNDFLAIVDSYFKEDDIDRQALHQAAKSFALGRGSHNGRTAIQFYKLYTAECRPR